uniref:CC domain-containing protein n=1 Tax=Rhabditophanes sp. KR3021 TaxID=114890 RepID=A0AC35UAK7_9BILA
MQLLFTIVFISTIATIIEGQAVGPCILNTCPDGHNCKGDNLCYAGGSSGGVSAVISPSVAIIQPTGNGLSCLPDISSFCKAKLCSNRAYKAINQNNCATTCCGLLP